MVANASAIPVADRDKVAEAKFCYVCDCNVVAKNGTGPQWTGGLTGGGAFAEASSTL